MKLKISTDTLIIGMSHVEAIIKAKNISNDDFGIAVVNLNSSPEFFVPKERKLSLQGIDLEEVSNIILSLGGNFHNMFGLIENPVKFTVGDFDASNQDSERHFIPHNMMVDYFSFRLQPILSHMKEFKKHFPDKNYVCLFPPPPINDDNHIRQFPGIFRPRLKNGIVPKELRMRLYKIQETVYSKFCDSLNIELVLPPNSTMDSNGFLLKDFWNNDPTHGNQNYGRELLTQLSKYTSKN